MKKYLISLPDDVDERITEIAKKKGITNNNEIRDTILCYYTQATSILSYSQIILDLENELLNIKEKLTDGNTYEFILGDLDTMKEIERISSNMKPSTVKAIIGKQFYAKVKSGGNILYEAIEYQGTKQRVAFYLLKN